MDRRQVNIALGLLAVGLCVGAIARVEQDRRAPVPWTIIPSITIISADDDPRIGSVREAVDTWNRTFAELESPFRLGAISIMTGSVSEADLRALGRQVMEHRARPIFPESLKRYPGDLVIVLSDANFISFTARHRDRTIIAIKNGNSPPLNLPNVLPNVIAHELGHAVGLEHNADPTLLMCGRPASCRPDAFQSETARFFPLSAYERSRLLSLYPRTGSPAHVTEPKK